MDLKWDDFFNDYEWLIVFLKGMVKPAAALVVVLLAVILSYSQNLSLEGEMIYSVSRSFLQLSVIGFVLQFIFNQENSGWIILAYLFMVSFNQTQDLLLCFF
jgi:putative ABC transport system permease protein